MDSHFLITYYEKGAAETDSHRAEVKSALCKYRGGTAPGSTVIYTT